MTVDLATVTEFLDTYPSGNTLRTQKGPGTQRLVQYARAMAAEMAELRPQLIDARTAWAEASEKLRWIEAGAGIVPGRKLRVLTSDNGEYPAWFAFCATKELAERCLQLINERFEGEEGERYDNGVSIEMLLTPDMTEEQLLVELDSGLAGVHGETWRTPCLASPWEGSSLLCDKPIAHPEIDGHRFVEPGEGELHCHREARVYLGLPPADPTLGAIAPCPGQLALEDAEEALVDA